jgi:hypothetical protein
MANLRLLLGRRYPNVTGGYADSTLAVERKDKLILFPPIMLMLCSRVWELAFNDMGGSQILRRYSYHQHICMRATHSRNLFLTHRLQYDTLKTWADYIQQSRVLTQNKLYGASYELQ